MCTHCAVNQFTFSKVIFYYLVTRGTKYTCSAIEMVGVVSGDDKGIKPSSFFSWSIENILPSKPFNVQSSLDSDRLSAVLPYEDHDFYLHRVY